MSNSLASVHPELIPEWSERNLPLTPDKITFGSNKRVWWKGACGHEWETSVKARSKGEKCPITVTKSDREEGTPQGDATLAGAVYGIYKGETLVDKYVTDKNGQFTTKEYVCDNDWTIREITPSEGYLLDGTIHKVGAEPQLYTVEHNQTANDVTEQVMKGNIAIIKHPQQGLEEVYRAGKTLRRSLLRTQG